MVLADVVVVVSPKPVVAGVVVISAVVLFVGLVQVIVFIIYASSRAATDAKQIRITSTLINFVAETLQPLYVVEVASFTKMFHAVDPRYQLPPRTHLTTTLITNKTTPLPNKMREELSNVASVCVTIDLWTSRQMRSYLGITGHYFQDYRLVSAMLARKRFKGRHTTANIYSSYADVFNITNKI